MTTPIKQIACGRRKPNMTRKEYNDHRYQAHGLLSASAPDKRSSPTKYIQVPVFDAAYGAAPGGLNLNHPWIARDDVTELWFDDMAHLQAVFSSEYVRTTIGPDGPKFADFGASISLMATEVVVPLATNVEVEEGVNTVAIYFLSTPDNQRNGKDLQEKVEKKLVHAIEEAASGHVVKVLANIGFTTEEFDLHNYFGGKDMPQYALVYKLILKGAKSVPYVRKAQKKFEELVGDGTIDFRESFILFSKEVLVMDLEKNTQFDPTRQPVFDEADYAASVSHLNT